MGAVIDAARSAKQEQDAAQAAAWSALVRDVADDQVTSGSDLAGRLDSLGRSTDDLASAVRALQHRREQQTRLADELPRLQGELERRETEIAASRAEADESRNRAAAIYEQNAPAVQSLHGRIRALERARQSLVATAPPEIRRALDAATESASKIRGRAGFLARLLTSSGRFYHRQSKCMAKPFSVREREAAAELAAAKKSTSMNAERRLRIAKSALKAVERERKQAGAELKTLTAELEAAERAYSDLLARAVDS